MSWIVILVLVAVVIAVGFALYTTQGSGVSQHPLPDQKPPPGPDPGDRGVARPGVDESESHELDQRGTDGS